MFEVDLMNPDCAWGTKFTVNDMCEMIRKWMMWVFMNIHEKAKMFLNIRDLPLAMLQEPERLLYPL